ncbi:MAG: polysaccharide biosynthesis tyrosine autokinase [Caldilineaceae bacterium]
MVASTPPSATPTLAAVNGQPPRLARPRVQENELVIYARLLWQWSWLIVLCALLGGVAAYVASRLSAPIYQATSTLLINEARTPGAANYQDLLASERISRTYAELLTRRPILARVAAQLGQSPDIFDEGVITNLNVTPVRDTQLIQIAVDGISPELVTAVANTLPPVFITEIQAIQSARFAGSKSNLLNQLQALEQDIAATEDALTRLGAPQTAAEEQEREQLQAALTQFQASHANLLQSYEELRLVEAQSMDNITVVEPADLPDAPIRPRTLLNTLLAAIVGAMLAMGVVFLLEYLDDRIRSPNDLDSVVDAAWLGAVPRIPNVDPKNYSQQQLITQCEPRHPISEAYRGVRTNLQFSNIDVGLRSLVTTSANPSEGKTTTVANLAVTMAQAGLRTVLVDADLRRPMQHKIFALSQSPGITDALVQPDAWAGAFVRATHVSNLYLLSSGAAPPNPAELLGSQRMQQLLSQIAADADVVLIDAPPLLAVTDAQILGRLAQGVVLVIDGERTGRGAVARAVAALAQVNVRLMGVVLNRMAKSARGYDYYYNDYYYAGKGDKARG